MTRHDIARQHRIQAERQQSPHAKQWRRLIKGLGKRGALFASIARGSKLPTRKAWNQTENGLTTQQAVERLEAGDNVTLLCGTGNLYSFDFDRGADRGYESEHLDGALYIYRENAPHKVKIIFSCPDPIPTRLKSKSAGIDLLGVNGNGTHWSCVLAGTHSSGAPILWGGHTIPTLPADTVAAMWEEWTGQSLFAPERDAQSVNATYTNADLARVADALAHVDPNDMDYNTWIGIIAALHDAFGDDALDLAVEWADGKPGEVESKWSTFDREYSGNGATVEGIFYRARQGGWQDTWLQERLRQYREWLASPAAIEALRQPIPAPSEDDPERTRKLFSNPERARKLVDTILQKCEAEQSVRITPGYDWLRKQSGISQGSIGDYLARLFTGGFINLKLGQKGGDATAIELVFQNLNSIYTDGDTIQILQNWNIYREFRADEAFLNNHAAYVETHTQAWLAQRYIGRNGQRLSKPQYEGEGLPLGDNGLGALLALLDGPTTIGDAAELVGYKYAAMARTMRRFVEHGLVDVSHGERNRKTYTLKPEWRAILDTNRPKMTTCTIQFGRNVGALKGRAKLLWHKGDDAKADKVDKDYGRQFAILKGVRNELGIIPFVPPNRVDPYAERLDRLKHAYHVGEKVETATRPPGYKPKRPDVSFFAADAEWGDLNAWAVMTYGAGWWVKRDVNGILVAYERYLGELDNVPTVHWDGATPTRMAVAA